MTSLSHSSINATPVSVDTNGQVVLKVGAKRQQPWEHMNIHEIEWAELNVINDRVTWVNIFSMRALVYS